MENRIDGRRIHHLSAEVAKFHCLDKSELIDNVSRADNARVGSHKSVDICPNLKFLGIESRSNECSSVVTTATTQVGYLAGVLIFGDKSRHHCHLACEIGKGLLYEFFGKHQVGIVLAKLSICLHILARIEVHSAIDDTSNNGARESFAIAHHDVAGAVGEVLNERNAAEYVAQFLEQRFHYATHFSLFLGRDHSRYHIFVTAYYLFELLQILGIALRSQLCSIDEFIGDSTQCRYYHYHLLVASFNYRFHMLQTVYCSNRCASKF